MKQTFLVLALGVLTACGSSPTMPTPTDAQPPVQATTNPPANPPTTPPSPAPAPAPTPTPAPAPAPSPAPTPAPAGTILHAVVTTSQWFPGAAFTLPQKFDVVIDGDTVKIATLDPLPFAFHKRDDEFIVKQKDFEFTVQGGTFVFNGIAGQATGTIGPAK